MRYFPLFHDTHNLRILIVGGGEVAARKVALWSRTEAVITVIAPDWVETILQLAPERIECITGVYQPHMLEGRQGVVAATDNAELNRQIAREAKALGMWVNVVDQPELCTVITPAIVDRSPIVVAIGSEGSAPVLVRTLRAMLEVQLPKSLGRLASFIGSQRQRIQAESVDPRLVWERFIERNGLELNDQSPSVLEHCTANVTKFGRLWLMHNAQPAQMLPIAVMPHLQRLDRILSSESKLPADLVELCRRDASQGVLVLADCEQLIEWVSQGEQLLMLVNQSEYEQWRQRLAQIGIEADDPYQPN